jgi:hypothetical protein
MTHELKLLLSFIAGLIALFVGLFFLVHWGHEVNCRATAEVMGLPYHYSINTPCMVQVGSQWFPLHSIRLNP